MENWTPPAEVGVWSTEDGEPSPLGVTWLPAEQAYNFALYSRHATRVELLFFRASEFESPAAVYRHDQIRNKSGAVWHCRVPACNTGDSQYYTYRVFGPAEGMKVVHSAFDSEKLLLDPYAHSVFFPPDFDREAARRPGSNIGRAALALLDECQCQFSWTDDRRIRHEADLIIYELHVRGFTQHPNSGLREKQRGTFAGVIEKIPYLVDLGITAVELMPVFQFDPQDGNYWGYMPLCFFAPHHGYSGSPDHCAQRSEFRRMVQALHAAGIEVILDVVFNHTCEGNADGPTYSFRGIDNSEYYLVDGRSAGDYSNFSGCGNTLRTASPIVRRLIVDSLRYWAEEMHVDGFRFDLASVFSRNADGSISLDQPPIFAEIVGDPILSQVRLIAEPWDAGGAFELGLQFPGSLWMQWNARYRETLQRFVRGDSGLIGDLMTRLYGSCDLFPDDRANSCRPWQSVNYITSHDGFTLYDLVSYKSKHNDANGHGNTDGANDFSDNGGIEGESELTPDVLQDRKQQVRNFVCLLMLSNGIPMFRMGDEFLQTQGGNNNPYNQDNETSWLDWQRLEQHRDVHEFFMGMIAFRKAHPSICRGHYWRGDVEWFGPDGPVDLAFDSQTLGFVLNGPSTRDDDLMVLINGSRNAVAFHPPASIHGPWCIVIDTTASGHNAFRSDHEAAMTANGKIFVQSKSIVVAKRTDRVFASTPTVGVSDRQLA
ncbi:MAG: glycogen-debranching protein [Planctomycetaceae bacterium]|nr:glycogen-debranching protein [Planctomycetaceae bacterium]